VLSHSLDTIDILVLLLYALSLVLMGIYFSKKTKTANQFMTADQRIPAWAAGLAVMSAYTSSISYIATPGKAFDDNWHPLIFALCMIPISWLVCTYIIPWYRKTNTISVYGFLEGRLGYWARAYAAFSFVLYMVGRMAVILYLASLLLDSFLDINLVYIIVIIGLITIVYTLMGGMEAVIWTDVVQSCIMIIGIIYCAVYLSQHILIGQDAPISLAYTENKFSLGSSAFSFDHRTDCLMGILSILYCRFTFSHHKGRSGLSIFHSNPATRWIERAYYSCYCGSCHEYHRFSAKLFCHSLTSRFLQTVDQ